MRKILFVILTSLAAMGVHAWEPTTAEAQPEDKLAQPSYAEAMVTIAPVPMPARVIELARYSPKHTSIGQGKKVKAAKVARVRSMLSRSAREQMALANTSSRPDGRERLNASDNEGADSGLDELDLHRSFSQPKVAKTIKELDDDSADDLPVHIKLRLLMARTKAVEAHILNQVGKEAEADNTELSDSVKLRLSAARARAMQAHSEKFGAA